MTSVTPVSLPAIDGPSVGRAEALLLGLAAVAVLACRTVLLDVYPPVVADEGGWPLNVRQWLTEGRVTKDYFVAPAYHWLLAIPFGLFGATLAVARWTSVVLGFVTLGLFYLLACRMLGGRRPALWATAILGISYPVVITERRALIESFQVAWLIAVVLLYLGRTRWERIGLMGATAGLLLTKVSAIFIVPALIVAGVVERPREWRSQLSTWAALVGGVVVAVAVFVALSRENPTLFASGWSVAANVGQGSGGPVLVRFGRFGLDPLGIADGIRTLTEWTPFLATFGVAGALWAMLRREQTVVVAWILFGSAFLLTQMYRYVHHWAVLFPAFALATAWMLATLDRRETPRWVGGVALTWPRLVMVVLFLYCGLRLAGGLATIRDPVVEAARWVDERADQGDRVLAAPYVLMQVDSRPVAFFEFRGSGYIPRCEQLAERDIRWVIVDRAEWRSYVAKAGAADVGLDRELQACAAKEFETVAAVVYRVTGPQAALRREPVSR